jgi:hypothetical protein
MATTLSVQIRNAELVRKGLENFSREIPRIGAQQIYDALLRAQKRLKEPGAKPTYPIHWDSEKQRRAFFATKGFGRGIPTKRTGKYVRSWHIRRNPRPARATEGYSLINDAGHARYVGGSAYAAGQSRIHAGRWVRVRDVLEQETRDLPKRIQEHIGMVARRERLH